MPIKYNGRASQVENLTYDKKMVANALAMQYY
jgi:hypothetical protein